MSYKGSMRGQEYRQNIGYIYISHHSEQQEPQNEAYANGQEHV